jgi:hypothetical protein
MTAWPLYARFASHFPNATRSAGAAFLFTLLIGVTIFLPIVNSNRAHARES